MMLKKILMFLLLAVFLSTSISFASSFTIETYLTEIKPSKTARGADGVYYNTDSWHSTIGSGFDNYGVSLTGNDSWFEFEIQTAFGPNNSFYGSSSNQTQLGDFFISTGESFNYAFNLSALDTEINPFGLYTVDSFTDSGNYFGDGYIFGSQYKGTTGDGQEIFIDPIVRMSSGDLLNSVEFGRSLVDDIYTYTISGQFDLISALGLSWGDSFDFLFATATCANSGMMGSVATTTPEPGTWLLFGTGLLGISWLGRKRLIKK